MNSRQKSLLFTRQSPQQKRLDNPSITVQKLVCVPSPFRHADARSSSHLRRLKTKSLAQQDWEHFNKQHAPPRELGSVQSKTVLSFSFSKQVIRKPNRLLEIQPRPSKEKKLAKARTLLNSMIESGAPHKDRLAQVKQGYEEYIRFLLGELRSQKQHQGEHQRLREVLQVKESELATLKSRSSADTKTTQDCECTRPETKGLPEVPRLRMVPSAQSFHDEFMSKYPEFSESWRAQISNHATHAKLY